MIPGRRIYEYRDEDGNTYWSFHKQITTVSSPRRLVLQQRIGIHLLNFLAFVRERGNLLTERYLNREDG